MPTVALTMIAKNEAAVITRALDSVRPIIDYGLVCDTGSSDGTQHIVADWMRANRIAGKIISQPWRNFGYNRSYVLAQLRNLSEIDYALILDADDVLKIEGDPAAIKQGLTSDAYAIPIRHGNLAHRRAHLCSNHKPFRFRGVIHEFLHCDEPFQQGALDKLSISIIGGGVRGRDREVYRHDAELLERAIADGTDEDLKPRYTFYLAQSWRDCGEREKALAVYLQRASMPGWIEEAYVALLNAARLTARLERPVVETLDLWKRAIALVPTRAEAYHGAAAVCRRNGCQHEALAFARRGLGRRQPEGLFIEPWVYGWGLLDEYAIAAYWAGLPAESWLAARTILEHDDVDAVNRKRIEKNAAFAMAACANAK
jgi:glycosyltransferase involved in cell wall biosynthesis